MRTIACLIAVLLSITVAQTAQAVAIGKTGFTCPTVLTFDDYTGFVGGPAYSDPWLSKGIRIWGSTTSGSDLHVYPYTNNAVVMEFLSPVQRVGADVLYSTTTTTRLEIFDAQGRPLEHIDGIGPRFLGLDAGAPIVKTAKFIDLPDVWSTFPNIDNLCYEVPEPAAIACFGAVGAVMMRRRRVSA